MTRKKKHQKQKRRRWPLQIRIYCSLVVVIAATGFVVMLAGTMRKHTEDDAQVRARAYDLAKQVLERVSNDVALNPLGGHPESFNHRYDLDPETNAMVLSLRRTLDEIIQKKHSNLEDLTMRFAQAAVAVFSGNSEDAKRALQLVTEDDAAEAGDELAGRIYLLRGLAFDKLESPAGALSSFRALLPLVRRDISATAPVQWQIGKCLLDLQQWDATIAHCDALIPFLNAHDELEPVWLCYAHYCRGFAHLEVEHFKEATEDFRAAIAHSQESPNQRTFTSYELAECRLRLAQSLRYQRRLDEELDELNVAVEQQRQHFSRNWRDRRMLACLLEERAILNGTRLNEETVDEFARDVEQAVEIVSGIAGDQGTRPFSSFHAANLLLLREKARELQGMAGAKYWDVASVCAADRFPEPRQGHESADLVAPFGISWSSTITETLSVLVKRDDTAVLGILVPLRTFGGEFCFPILAWNDALETPGGLEDALQDKVVFRPESFSPRSGELIDNYDGGFVLLVERVMKWKDQDCSMILVMVFKGNRGIASIQDRASLAALGGLVLPRTVDAETVLTVWTAILRRTFHVGWNQDGATRWEEGLSGIDSYFEARLANFFLAEPAARKFWVGHARRAEAERIFSHKLMIRELFNEHKPVEQDWTEGEGNAAYWTMRARDRKGSELYAWAALRTESPRNLINDAHVVFYLRRAAY